MKNEDKKKVINHEGEVKEKNTISKLNKGMIILGTIFLSLSLILLAKHFFVDRSDIKNNYSTDKKVEYVALNGKEELVYSQKYISDLGYNMRYDVENFKVVRYKDVDIYRYLDNLNVVFSIEKAIIPTDCVNTKIGSGINNCYKRIDNTMDEYYLTSNYKTYRILIKTPNDFAFQRSMKERIQYMINSFEIR